MASSGVAEAIDRTLAEGGAQADLRSMGDHRDWDAIHEWAEGLKPVFLSILKMGASMKALLLDGSREQGVDLAPAKRMLLDELRAAGYEVQELVLRDLQITPCIGGFGCWIKTPGLCVVPDAGREVARAIIGSDLAILFTPVTFGGYSSELKKVLDRSICVLLPFFTSIGGETHHPLRYSRFPNLIAVGVQPHEDAESEAIFTTLVHKNAVNMHGPFAQLLVIRSGRPLDDARTRVKSALAALEVKR